MSAKRRWIVAAAVAAALAAAAVAAAALLPFVLCRIDWPAVEVDLSKDMKSEQRALFTNLTARVKFRVERSKSRDLRVRGSGVLLDWPVSVDADVSYSLLSLSARGEATARLVGTPWGASADFEGGASGGWTAALRVPETAFDGNDPVLGALVARLAAGSAELVSLSGRLSLDATAAATNCPSMPVWKASARLSDVSADLKLGDAPVALRGLRVRGGASGIGPHADIDPMFPRAESLDLAGVALSNVYASARATESAWLVTEAGADVLGGTARLYALFLDPARLNAGFTLYLDEIDSGEALRRIAGFRGEATGRLHGKLPLRVRKGAEVSFGDAYLYSAPGETGTLRIEEAAPLMDALTLSGVSAAQRENLAKALKCLDYTALGMSLRRDGESHALALKLEGTATSGKTSAPVTLAVTLRGEIERIVNTGIRAAGGGAGAKGGKK